MIGAFSLLVWIVTGCHTVSRAVVADPAELSGRKQVCVVESDRKDRGFRREIERNLTSRGFVVTAGKLEQMSPDAELYVVFEDKWSWDMVMYPREVKIALDNAKTRELLGSAEFKNAVFHTYADPPEITDELLGRIFGEPEGSHMD